MKISSRSYESGDEYPILDLFKQVFKREMSLEFWRWRFVNNPFGKAVIRLSFDASKLVGHYAVIPMNVQVQGKSTKAALSMTTMVHQDYRGSGIFTNLAQESYKAAAERGTEFVFAFPNENSYYPFIKMLGWKGFGKMSILEKDVETNYTENASEIDVHQIERFDSRIDLLWDKVKQRYPVIVPRTRQFLNWRFVQSPDETYTKFVVGNNEELLGYVVLKVYVAPTGGKGHIVDMLTVEDEAVVRKLLRRTYSYFTAQGINNISCWCQDNSFYAHILEAEGFSRKEMEGTYFGIKILDGRSDLLKSVESFPNWFLSMGDSDVF